jgi:hypothetical protein
MNGATAVRGARVGRLAVSLLAAVLAVAGCAGQPDGTPDVGPTEAPPPASLAVLTGQWRAEPVALDPVVEADADRTCRTDPELPGGMRMVLVDARGGGRLMALYVGPGGLAECGFLEIDAKGAVTGSLSDVSGDANAGPPPGRLSGISAGGSDGGETGQAWQEVHGRAGPGITRVVITVEDVGRVTATLRDGVFSAWWPIDETPKPRVWMKDYAVTAYDILGQQIDRYAKCGPGPC